MVFHNDIAIFVDLFLFFTWDFLDINNNNYKFQYITKFYLLLALCLYVFFILRKITGKRQIMYQ